MDSPADALLALSNTAAAMADTTEMPAADDDRSSSLSELEDAPDNMELEDGDDADEEDEDEDEDENDEEEDEEEEDEEEDDDDDNDDEEEEEEQEADPQQEQRQPLPPAQVPDPALADGDSEAETERLEESPDKTKRTFQISPSKLAQSMNASDHVRPEIEELTNTDASSPITPVEDSPLDDLSEAEDVVKEDNPLNILSQAATVTNKRKRLSDVMDMSPEERPRKRRTASLSEPEDDDDVDDAESDAESENENERAKVPTRDPTVEPEEPEDPEDAEAAEADDKADQVEVEGEGENDKAESSDASKSKKPEQYTRSRSRRGKDLPEEDAQDEGDNEAEGSDDEAEADDVDVVAKSEEEQAKRSAAMDALTALEQHFASLRDKLYDEKISQINHELSQLSAAEPDHPELLKQFECVNKYRDEKQDIEQKLLVFKVGALKRKSVAERSQIHSAYFQTVRDVRERHMERMSEHFYRVQRERFKSTQVTPTYTVPFPDKRVAQVTQQTAYNKEVSILSGVAKYVGFPAAPKLKETPDSDLNADLQKMGIHSSSARIRSAAQARQAALSAGYTGTNATAAISSSAAAASASSEQQFIESTPWANPNHPIHRLSRQNANKSPFAESYAAAAAASVTPANQQKRSGVDYTPGPIGSASTIVENPSTGPTPSQTDGVASSAARHDAGQANGAAVTNGNSGAISPSETRRTINNMLQAGATAAAQQRSNTPASTGHGEGNAVYLGVNSSPLQAKASLLSGLNRTASAAGMRENTRSPFRQDLVASGGGMGRFGFR